jgi:endonuclease YncB( thermonuclease family)
MFLAIGVAASLASPIHAQPRAVETLVGNARVVDGDTLNIDGQSIRMWGIDAPESRQACQSDQGVIPCGQLSTHHLQLMIGDQAVRCEISGRDRYGRMVGICYAINQRNASLNQLMVRNGWAFAAYHTQRYNFCDDQKIAENQGSGLWQWRFQFPWEFRGSQARTWCR